MPKKKCVECGENKPKMIKVARLFRDDDWFCAECFEKVSKANFDAIEAMLSARRSK